MRALDTSGFGRSENAVRFNKSAGIPKGKGKYFYCQKDGHWKRDCYQKKSDVLKEANQQSRGEQSGLAFTIAECTSTTQARLDWIIDSGASQYLCYRKEMFLSSTYKEIPHRGIEIADGSLIEAIGMGDIGIGSLLLSGVLFVPRVGGNLISVGRLIDAGYDVSFGSTICTICKEQDCLKGRRQGNLYYLQDENKIEMAHLGLASNKPMPETVTVCHKRLGPRTLDQAAIHYLQPRVSDFKIKSDKEISGEQNLCETCAHGCQHKEAITGSRDKANEPLEVVHTDICGPMQVSTINGERYFITFIDERSGRIAVTLLKTKSEAIGAFQAYKARAEKEAEREIKRLRSDGGGEYMGLQFKSCLRVNGISHTVSPPYSPSHNGLAERANRTLIESARCMLEEAGLDKAFWGFAVATAAHIHNRLPSRSHLDRSPLEYWDGKKPSLAHLRICGSVTYTHIPTEKHGKFDSKSVKCILLGYDEEAGSRVYRLFNPTTKPIECSRDVIIDEYRETKQISDTVETGSEIEIELPDLQEQEIGEERRIIEVPELSRIELGSENPNLEEFGGDTIVVRPPAEVLKPSKQRVSQVQPRRSGRQRNSEQATSANTGRAMVAYVEEPQTLDEALGSENGKQWHEAWESEVDSLIRNKTWVLTQLPAGREPIGCRWPFKRKDDGGFKACLVAKGYSQKEGIDYNETFAPVAQFNSLRTLLALVCKNNWELEGMDVKTAFLHSELDEMVFMDIPEGLYTETSTLEDGEPMVCQLVKSIY